MKKYSVSAVYFSATDTSRKGAAAIAGVFDANVNDLDMTVWNRQPVQTEFGENDLVVFGAPVYSGRIYQGAFDRFRRLHGSQTPCIITVTYGNRDYEDALLELYDLVSEQGFLPFAAAALIGQHTYGNIQVGRPAADDLREDEEFARKASEKLAAEGPSPVYVPGNRSYKKENHGGNGGRFRPLTNEDCIHCGLCARMCPEGAINHSNYSIIDNAKCIACFRCIRTCPVQAKNIDTDEYSAFAKMFTAKLSQPRRNEYFI